MMVYPCTCIHNDCGVLVLFQQTTLSSNRCTCLLIYIAFCDSCVHNYVYTKYIQVPDSYGIVLLTMRLVLAHVMLTTK